MTATRPTVVTAAYAAAITEADWMRRKAEGMQDLPWLLGGRGRRHGNTGGTP